MKDFNVFNNCTVLLKCIFFPLIKRVVKCESMKRREIPQLRDNNT